jgi:hypothetical protein
MNRMRLKLIPGKEYLFTHKRRGTLHARYLRIVRAPGTDPDDEYYLDCEILSPGLFPGETSTISTSTLLRPSMISLLQDVPANYSPGDASSTAKTSSEETPRRRIGNALRKLLRGLRVG